MIIGSILQNTGGTLNLQFNASATSDAVRDTVRAIRYANTGDTSTERSVNLLWTLDDNNTGAQGGGFTTSDTQQTVHIKPQRYQAIDDVLGGEGIVSGSGSYGFLPSAITSNDLGNGTDNPFIVSTTNPTIGTLTNAGGTYGFSTTAGDTGTSTFDYLAATGNSDMISQWPLRSDGSDEDNTDSDFGWSGYKYDVTGFEEDGRWHNYAIVVREGTGTSIYIDGIEQDTSSATRGEAPFTPADPIYVGVGDHSIIGLDSWLTNHQVANMRLLNGFDEPTIQANELNQYSSATVSITVRNEESLEDNNSLTVNEDQTEKILNTSLQTTDIDDPPTALTYTLDTAPAFGTLLLNGSSIGAGDSFTQQQIDDEAVSYRHDGNETATSDSFDFTVDDGVGSATADTFSLTLNPLNDAPVMGTGTLADADEDSTPAGDTIANIFSGQLVDDDGSLAGIAITYDASTTEGQWQYSTDSGVSWFNVDAVTTNLALVLDSTATLRFLPAEHFNGAVPGLTLYAIDNTYAGATTSGASRVTADVTIRGGTTPFALDASTISTSTPS